MDAISCLAPPPAALLQVGSSSFADAAIARALHYSMSSSAAHHSPLLADITLPPAYTAHATTCDSVLVATDSPPGRRRPQHKQQQQLGPAGGRAGKRRSRASKRAPTTYISTDPANFRIMVQHITGAQADPSGDSMLLHPTAIDAAAAFLMAADASAAAAYGNPLLPVPAAAGGDEASALQEHHQLQQQQQPCFPTLDSWNVMYERSSEML